MTGLVPTVVATIQWDPSSGNYRLRIGEGEAARWTQPMTLPQLDLVLKHEYHRRASEGRQESFYANQISASTLLELGLFNEVEVKKLSESHPALKAAKKRKADQEAWGLSVEDILKMANQ